MSTPRVSLIVPVLDEALGIAATLDALAALRAQGHEVIVVDGGSRDDTVARCAGRADQVLAAPRGRARQMNAGAAAAHGEVLLFLHADTRLPADALAAVADALARGASWGRFDVRIEGRSAMFPVIAWMMNARSRLTGMATGDQAIFVRRALFASIGGYPDQPLMEDIELSRRLKRHGAPACLRLRVATSGRRWEQHGVWRTIVLMWRLRLRYWLGTPADALARAYR
ncbi:TIGR04283 family arsenosugar biosynthesis glycosyltransferase [Ideonella sp. A 288]|uniref:TIGR04283 family arsenosugar biosynthesis glycosyltransferase n=1 Tax=Ideonella sp. A 288 TaxID=1962181 RepID=UPI000B4B49A2|nr:TIGR04283 family arsenosugar biosynthesis glycosyltransferase [Ideonella sp. A 288]